jgi:hypothetical protein
MLSGCGIGAGVIACADTATDKAKPAIAINLIILHLPKPSENLHFSRQRIVRLVFKQRKLPALVARRLEINQGLCDGRAGTSPASGRIED